MKKNNLVRGSTVRGDSSIRGGKTRGSASGRGSSTSKSTLTARGGSDASPIRNTVVARGGLASRGKGKDPLLRTRDDSIEKNGSKKSEKKVYKVSLTNAIVKKLIAAKSRGVQMKINISDKMEIDAGEDKKIQLNLSSPKKVEMIYIRNDDIVEPIGNVIGYASTTMESHEAAKRDLAFKKVIEKGYKEEKKRGVQVLDKAPSEQGKTKSKRQKNNAGSSIKVQQSPPMTYLSSSKVSSQLSNVARGSKPLRGKTRGGRTKPSINTTVAAEVADVNDESTITTASARGGNVTRSGKTTGGGKSTRGRGAKTIIFDAQKVSTSTAQSTTATRGKRGRPAGVTNRTTRGAKTYNTMTTRTSTTTAFKTSATVKNDNDQLSMSEGTTSSSSKKGKGKTNGQLALSEWKPGQTITILTEFKQARKICEEMENDIQEIIEDLGAYENFYNTYISSIRNGTKGSNHDLREIEKQFGEGSPANKLMQRYLQLEKDIKIIYDELWRAAKEGPIYED